MTSRGFTRREVLAGAIAGAGALTFGGCGGSHARPGSTLEGTWIDPLGTGQLVRGPGEPLLDRTDLARRASTGAVLATLAHLTDAHVLDASSPARVTFLDRLGPPFQSTFRPQEALTVPVLAGAAASVRALAPDLVIQGGDLIDNAQRNELQQALGALHGGRLTPGSGPHGYFGVQSAFDPDPFYYRPDLDAPRHPGLLRDAVRPLSSGGVGAPAYPVLGDHDLLVAGEIVPTALTRSLALGSRAIWELPPDLSLPPGAGEQALLSPDGPPAAGLVNGFLVRALAGPSVTVPADPARVQMSAGEAVGTLARASGPAARGVGAMGRLDYTLDVGRRVRIVVLDLARRGGGSGGLVVPGQPEWLERQLRQAGDRWIVAVSHQPLDRAAGGEQLLGLLDQAPRVIAALAGHTHRNRIEPRRTARGSGYWLIETASLIDYPQQARALRVLETSDGGVALQTWMLDHTFPGTLGTTARELSYLDAQGGRPNGFDGSRRDRNVTLYVRE